MKGIFGYDSPLMGALPFDFFDMSKFSHSSWSNSLLYLFSSARTRLLVRRLRLFLEERGSLFINPCQFFVFSCITFDCFIGLYISVIFLFRLNIVKNVAKVKGIYLTIPMVAPKGAEDAVLAASLLLAILNYDGDAF